MFDLGKWIKEHNVPIDGEPKEEKGIRKYYLPCCPFDSSHTGKDAIIFQDLNTGKLCFECKHNSCQDKHWKDFRKIYEPDFEQKAISKKKDAAEDLVELPPIKRWSEVYQNVPSRAPELINGILRQGHKMLISGASKAGKSFLLIELAIAITEGWRWLGFQCHQGKVLYINLEIDDSSFANRVNDIYNALSWLPHHREDFFYWTLRGMADPLDELAPKIIEAMKEKSFAAVIIDPIYKVIMGDENNASDMGRFCNQFDKICREAGCAAIYCHHHSKGGQGNKKAIDRASGSGVFGRDPDAILDMIELELTSEESFGHPKWATAWRMETSLREFRSIDPINFWFEYPLHKLDDTGELEKLKARGSSLANLEKSGKKNSRKENAEKVRSALEYLIGADGTNHTTIKAVMEYLGEDSPSDTAIRSYLKELLSDQYEYKNKLIFEKPLQAVDCDDLPFDTEEESKNESKVESVSSSEKKSKSKKRTK